MTPRGHQISTTRMLHSYRTRKDLLGLRAYLRSDEFMRHFAGTEPRLRDNLIVAIGKAMSVCQERLPPPKRQSTRQWDAARIEKLRRAYLGGKDHYRAAIALGVSPDAARLARWRYLGAGATQQAA